MLYTNLSNMSMWKFHETKWLNGIVAGISYSTVPFMAFLATACGGDRPIGQLVSAADLWKCGENSWSFDRGAVPKKGPMELVWNKDHPS